MHKGKEKEIKDQRQAIKTAFEIMIDRYPEILKS